MARNSEQEPLLPGQDEANVSGDSHVKDSRLETVVLIVIIFGVFLSMACESFVTATHGEIASSFNNLWMGPWLLTAYGMGYSMMLPLVGHCELLKLLPSISLTEKQSTEISLKNTDVRNYYFLRMALSASAVL